MLKYTLVVCVLLYSSVLLYKPAFADCIRCYSITEALQSQERVESLVLSEEKVNLEGIEQLPYLTNLFINLHGVEQFPNEILKLTNLKALTIEGNTQLNIDKIACKLRALPNLQQLELRNFNCPIIPESVLQLTQLQQLKISKSGVKEVPAGIAKLSRLYYLNLNDNQLEFLPEEIGQLQNLNVLELQYNRFQSLPEVLEQLQKIYFISVTGNPLTKEAKEKLRTSKINYSYTEDDAKKQEPEEPDRR